MASLDAIKALGVVVKTEVEARREFGDIANKPEYDGIKPPLIHVKGGDKQMAVTLGLIPRAYMDVEFDVQHIKDNVMAQAKATARKFKVKRFKNYIQVLSLILSKIRSGSVPDCSYLLGAPNGFGKTSFVTTCLKLMYAQDWKAVPYISLAELADIRVENEKRIVKGIEIKSRRTSDEEDYELMYKLQDSSEVIKMPRRQTECYGWSEYMNADILFCFMSSLDSKVIESNTLKGLLDIRGAKGLPTVVFISTSLEPYKTDHNLREYVWEEILAYKEDTNCFDRVYHVSCYKQPNNIIGDDDLDIETE